MIADSEGEKAARLAFRAAMLELGHDERIRNLYRIQDKLTQKAVFFKPNKSQERYLKDKTNKNLILKCRQLGFTTLNCVRAYDLANWVPNTKAGILCHKQNVLETIFTDITKFTHDWFVKDWKNFYSPNLKTSTGNSLSFKDDGLGRSLDSSIRVMFDFRSKTITFLHISESARIDKKRLTGSINSVPDNGEITQETTANGRGGEFYRLWQIGKKMGKFSEYTSHFYAWFEHYPEESGRWEPEDDVVYTPYEKSLLRDYSDKITPEHLMWRRYCIQYKCEGDTETFENEYPTNDVDCFLTGQAKVFPSSTLKYQQKFCSDPAKIGFLTQDGKKIELVDDERGIVTIWKQPDPSSTYVIGADPAGGVGKDMAGAYVKDQRTKEHVAKIWGDVIPEDFAKELYKLGMMFNTAWICVEANNHGGTVIYVLKQLQYTNLYQRQTIDERTNKPTRKIGFWTTNDSKLLLTETYKNSCRKGDVRISDTHLIDEMSNFMQYGGKGQKGRLRREAVDGEHDDLVMAACFTEEMDKVRSIIDEDRYGLDVPEFITDPDTGFIENIR